MSVTIRALVIAIEDYPAAEGISPRLEGTNKAAEDFIAWLKDKKGVPAEHIRYCAAEGRPGRTTGTLRTEIVRAARELADEGRDATKELYVFFSGHGFSFQEGPGQKPADILVASDFTTPGDSGGACIRLRELQEKLQMSFGPGDHYYFIDACRNPLSEDDIEPTKLGVKFEPSMLGIGTLFTLYSTASQSVAHVDSGFCQHLIAGLSGRGRAKGWVGKQMYVTFDLLRRYVRAKMPNQDADIRIEGSGDGYIIELKPVPKSDCRVRVLNASAEDTFTAFIHEERGDQRLVLEERRFQGPETRFAVAPGEYVIAVEHPRAPVRQHTPREAGPVDAYDACEVVFEKARPVLESFSTPRERPGATINILGADDIQLEVALARDISRPVFLEALKGVRKGLHTEVAPGDYQVRLSRRGKLLRHVDVTLSKGMKMDLDLGQDDQVPRPLRELGLTTSMPAEERTTALMLSLLGASHIVTPEEQPERVRSLPLQALSGVRAGESLLYVLAFFEQGVSELRIATGAGGGATPQWRSMRRVAGVDGLWEGALPAPAGPSLLSMQRLREGGGRKGAQPTLSVVTHQLPHRATLITLNEGTSEGVGLHQYLLPLHHLHGHLPDPVRYSLLHPVMRHSFVQALWEVQHEFARKRVVETSLERDNRGYWRDALYGKWVDPTMALFAAYELLRRRRQPDGDRTSDLHIAVGNLRRFFAGIPDIELLAKLAGFPYREPQHPPLILDGLLAWDAAEDMLPLDPGRLTYEGPWVMWRNAVPPPSAPPPPAVL
jgi:hypothetical protein